MTGPASPSIDGVPNPEPRGGTPSALQDALTLDALDTIEFPDVLEQVAARAAGPLGADRIRRRRPCADLTWIRHELAQVEEVASLFRRGDGLAAEAVPDLRAALARLRVEGSVLDGREMAQVRQLLVAARRVREDLVRVKEQVPLSASLLAELPARQTERRLEQSVDDDGQLLDSASPALASARRAVHSARDRLVRRLEGILRSLGAGSAEAGVTVRHGRYVIPVRRDLRSRPDGIVHDESASAETLFVEPAAAVEMGNALREAHVAEEREVLRVLRDLSDLLRPDRPLLNGAFRMVVEVDDLVARARWAADLDAHAPSVEPAPAALEIRRGRHPLLIGGARAVVPFDLVMEPHERTLLVSGPNTGGKTVLLKAVALAAALAQSGIVPPLAAGSRLPVFGCLAADIGDRQSIAASLSTFSAHVERLAAILGDAGADALVLLDEIGSGTDPAEGAALAAAAICRLTQRGALTLATTHLGQLKTLAGDEPGVVNASLQFDAATLTPTYQFQKGVPGRSYGLAIGSRLGLDAEVLADAERRVPAAERRLDALLAAVETRQRDVERREESLGERERATSELAERLEAREARLSALGTELDRRDREAERHARAQARAFLLDARRTVEAALAEARGAADDSRARDARRRLEDEIRLQAEALDAEAVQEPEGAGGSAVPVAGEPAVTASGITGTVLELRDDGKAVLAAGAMRLVLPVGELTRISRREARRDMRQGARGPSGEAGIQAPMEVDLRGMTGDEAEAATLAALDAAVLAEHPFLRIIHGMGTGVVRDRVQRVVRRDRRVREAAFAPRNQGGTGVTIVELG